MRCQHGVVERDADSRRIRHLKATIHQFGLVAADDIEIQRALRQLVLEDQKGWCSHAQMLNGEIADRAGRVMRRVGHAMLFAQSRNFQHFVVAPGIFDVGHDDVEQLVLNEGRKPGGGDLAFGAGQLLRTPGSVLLFKCIKVILKIGFYFFGRIMKPSLLDRVTIEVGKCGGRPCIRGLRIRVTDILGLLGAGASHQEILEDYPFLEENDILASLEYAAVQTDHAILISA